MRPRHRCHHDLTPPSHPTPYTYLRAPLPPVYAYVALSRYCCPAFFSRTKTASTLGTIAFFVVLFPYFALTGDDVPASARRAGCLLPPTCLALGTLPFVEFEDSGEVSRPGVTACLLLLWWW